MEQQAPGARHETRDAAPAPLPAPRLAARQFAALLRKNATLTLRSRRSLFGLGGAAGLLLQARGSARRRGRGAGRRAVARERRGVCAISPACVCSLTPYCAQQSRCGRARAPGGPAHWGPCPLQRHRAPLPPTKPQVLLPALFFAVMWVPRYYIKPIHHPAFLPTSSYDLDSKFWAGPSPYEGGRGLVTRG